MTSNNSSLTIAIPTYNRANKVAQLAHSILDQLQPGEELLVVDDGSSDNTSDLLCAIPGVRLHTHTPNQGMVKTWNACLRLASNDWVCIIHDDDILADGALQAIRSACLAAHEPAVIMHVPIDKVKTNAFIYKIFSPGYSAVMCSVTGTTPSGVVVHREIVDALGGFDEELSYSSDIEYFARTSAHYKLVVIESPKVVLYQLHNDNYQYKTWLRTDFFSQYEEIQRRVVAHSGLDGANARALITERTADSLRYIIEQAEKLGNKVLMRKFGFILWRAQGYGRRRRLRGMITLLKSWLPLNTF